LLQRLDAESLFVVRSVLEDVIEDAVQIANEAYGSLNIEEAQKKLREYEDQLTRLQH
jgi:hypothetical protein